MLVAVGAEDTVFLIVRIETALGCGQGLVGGVGRGKKKGGVGWVHVVGSLGL